MSPRLHASKRLAFVAPIAFVTAVLMAACGSSSGDDSSSSFDAGTDGSHAGDGNFVDTGDPCSGLGCASMAGPAQIRVLDTNGNPVPSPTFSANGNPVEAVCETDAGQILEDAGSCDPWTLDTLPQGPNTITVSAAGYESNAVSVTVLGPNGCCGIGATVDASVTLTASGDAGDGG